jgi:hypothetical protein
MSSMSFAQRVFGFQRDGSIREPLAAADDSLIDVFSSEFGQMQLPGLVSRLEVVEWVRRDLGVRYCSIFRAARRDGGNRQAWAGARRVLLGIAMGVKVCGYGDLSEDAIFLAGLCDHLAYL